MSSCPQFIRPHAETRLAVHELAQKDESPVPAIPSLALKPQHIVRADAVILAQRAQVADRHFVDAVFISGIDLLGGAEHARDGALLQVPVLAEFAKDFPIFLHGGSYLPCDGLQGKYIYAGSGVLTNTPLLV